MFRDPLRATLVAILALAVAPFAAADDPPDPAAIRALVEQLGHPRFSAREKAMDDLLALSSAALAPLQDALQHPDREIRYRAARLVAIIEKQDFERRLAAFRRDTSETDDHGLADWERFQKLLGSTAEARGLFIEMQRAESKLLARDVNPKAALDALNERTTEIQNLLQTAPQQVGLGTTASLLYVAAQDDLDPPDQTDNLIYSLCYQPAFSGAIRQENPQRDLLRKLLSAWIVRGKGATTLYRGVSLALQHDLRDGLVPAERILREEVALAPAKQYAVLAIMRFGNGKQGPLLEKLLSDTTICSQQLLNKERYVAQLGDLALVALIHQAKEDPKTFGFERAETHPLYVYNASTLGFRTDEERAAARAKWAEHRKK